MRPEQVQSKALGKEFAFYSQCEGTPGTWEGFIAGAWQTLVPLTAMCRTNHYRIRLEVREDSFGGC
jgi:hypothetical protein